MRTKILKFIFVKLFLIVCTSTSYSQHHSEIHFEVKHSTNDISAQRELFKDANVEFAIVAEEVSPPSYSKKIVFDKDGKILSIIYLNGINASLLYEYDEASNLILIRDSSFENPTQLIYDHNGNVIRFISDEIDEKYYYNDANELINSEIIDQVVEVDPIESVKYKNGKISQIKWKCWDIGSFAPFTFYKVQYAYDSDQRIIHIKTIHGNCKEGTEEVFSETKIEYNEKNLPVKYITTDMHGSKDIKTIDYIYFNEN